jgi:hypothetical protein
MGQQRPKGGCLWLQKERCQILFFGIMWVCLEQSRGDGVRVCRLTEDSLRTQVWSQWYHSVGTWLMSSASIGFLCPLPQVGLSSLFQDTQDLVAFQGSLSYSDMSVLKKSLLLTE